MKKSPTEQMERSLSEMEDRYHGLQQQLTETTLELDGATAQLPPLEEALTDLSAQAQKQRVNVGNATATPLEEALKEQIIQLKAQQALKSSQKKWLHEELNKMTDSMKQLRTALQKATLEYYRLRGDLGNQKEWTQRLNADFQNAQRFASENNFGSLVRVIVSPELPENPIAPAQSRIIILATLAGAFLGIIAAFIAHAIDERRKARA